MNLSSEELSKIDTLIGSVRESLVTIAGYRQDIKHVYNEINEMRAKNELYIITSEISDAQRRLDILFSKKTEIETQMYKTRRNLQAIIEFGAI